MHTHTHTHTHTQNYAEIQYVTHTNGIIYVAHSSLAHAIAFSCKALQLERAQILAKIAIWPITYTHTYTQTCIASTSNFYLFSAAYITFNSQ